MSEADNHTSPVADTGGTEIAADPGAAGGGLSAEDAALHEDR